MIKNQQLMINIIILINLKIIILKKLRYCSFDHCFKIANFKDNSTNKKYCKIHSNNNVVNINNKSNFIKCKYNNCKKNINSNFNYCQNHKFKCKKIIAILEY